MQTKNIPLMKQTLDYIERNPHEWDQDWFICGTKACFAGWAVQLSGFKPDSSSSCFVVPDSRLDNFELITYLDNDSDFDKINFIPSVASNLLRLNQEESGELFHYNNTLEDLQRIVARYITEDLQQKTANAESQVNSIPISDVSVLELV